jgi:hypothetical protein
MTIPNTDGYPPGAKTELYSFDHDLGQFVSIGPATVSDDGSVIVSDPGVGVIKGGWHSAGNPPPPGDALNCHDGNPCTEDAVVIEPCQGNGCTSRSYCRNNPLEEGAACQMPAPRPGAGILCRDDFIDIEIAASCDSGQQGDLGVCFQNQCRSGPFNSTAIATAALEALREVCVRGPGCVGDPLRAAMRACARQNGVRITCDPNPNQTRCAYVPLPPLLQNGCPLLGDEPLCVNELVLSPNSALPICSSLSSILLHEMVHGFACDAGAGGVAQHNTGTPNPADRPYGCQESCFPGTSFGRGTSGACQ